MHRTTVRLILTAALSVPGVAHSEPTQYRCKADYTVGYAFENGRWVPSNFTPSAQYVIRRVRSSELTSLAITIPRKNATWGVFEPSENILWAACEEPGSETMGVLGGALVCSGLAEVQFDRGTLRFQIGFRGNYTSPAVHEEQGDNPALTIGRCSPQ